MTYNTSMWNDLAALHQEGCRTIQEVKDRAFRLIRQTLQEYYLPVRDGVDWEAPYIIGPWPSLWSAWCEAAGVFGGLIPAELRRGPTPARTWESVYGVMDLAMAEVRETAADDLWQRAYWEESDLCYGGGTTSAILSLTHGTVRIEWDKQDPHWDSVGLRLEAACMAFYRSQSAEV